MSADNCYYVFKAKNGKYGADHRMMSDESDWAAGDGSFDTLTEALFAAHRAVEDAPYPVEYGVVLQSGLLRPYHKRVTNA